MAAAFTGDASIIFSDDERYHVMYHVPQVMKLKGRSRAIMSKEKVKYQRLSKCYTMELEAEVKSMNTLKESLQYNI